MSTELRDSDRSELLASIGNGAEPISESRTDERLTAIERELGTQGREAKKTRQAYGLFAVMAVVIAIVNLIVIAAKLDTKDTATAGTSQPAAVPSPLRRSGTPARRR